MGIKNILVVFTFALLLVLPGCNKVENQTVSGSRLVVLSITGRDLEGAEGSSTIFSDVVEMNEDGSFTYYNDNGVAELKAQLLDPTKTQAESTYYNDIVVDQVDVEFSRSDGQNEQGKDVPYSFSQKVNAVIPIGITFDLPFVLVPHNAKMESPLVDLIYSGQEKILKLEARVTFHGKDLGGHRVDPAVGYVSVWCANFGDE
jgi:hypothetical protein